MERKEETAERREYRVKKNEKGSNRLYYLILALIAVAVLAVLSLTVFFHINEVYVTGDNVPYKSEDIVFASGIETDTNIILANTSEPKERVESKMPYIESVEVIKHFPFKIELKVTASKIIGQAENGNILLIDRRGRCIDKIDKLKKGVPVVRGTGVITAKEGEKISFGSENALKNLLTLNEAIQKSKIKGITVYNIGDEKQISATYKNKIVLNFGNCDNLDEKIAYAEKIIDKQKDGTQTGILNLSRIPGDKQYAYFSPEVLQKNATADVLE